MAVIQHAAEQLCVCAAQRADTGAQQCCSGLILPHDQNGGVGQLRKRLCVRTGGHGRRVQNDVVIA